MSSLPRKKCACHCLDNLCVDTVTLDARARLLDSSSSTPESSCRSRGKELTVLGTLDARTSLLLCASLRCLRSKRPCICDTIYDASTYTKMHPTKFGTLCPYTRHEANSSSRKGTQNPKFKKSCPKVVAIDTTITVINVAKHQLAVCWSHPSRHLWP